MNCRDCFKDRAKAFEKATCHFPNRRSLVVFLLNVVLNVKDLWKSLCYCEKRADGFPSHVCQFRTVYLNDEYDIYQNLFDLNFLIKFHTHLLRNLKCILFKTDSHFSCHLINKKFCYIHKDWFDGSKEQFFLPYFLDLCENRKINDIKNNDFKVVLDPIIFDKYK